MNFRTKVLSCVVLLALFAYQGLRNESFSITNSEDTEQHELVLLPGEYSLDSTNTTFFSPTKSMKNFCVPWSVNTDDWWTHEPEWEVAEENEHFTCFRKNANQSQSAVVWRRIYQNQFRNDKNDCSSTYTRHMWSSGFGTDMENVVLGMQVAMLEKHAPLTMTLIDKPWWHYSANKNDGSNATCLAKDMSCYFLPLTDCKPNARQADKNPITLIRKYNKDFMLVYNYVTRPQQWLRKEIYDMVRPMEMKLTTNSNNARCTVVHVRRADVVLHGSQARKYFSMADYVKLLPSTKQQEKHTVLLLTDDANAIDEALEFHSDVANWVYFDRPRHRGTAGGWEEQVPSRDPKKEVITILATLKLVQRCETLISSRSKFADALSRAMGPNTTKLQVDSEMSGNVLDANNSASAEQLATLLEEKRNQQEIVR